MTAKDSNEASGLLRRVSQVAAVVGAIGSVTLVLYAGRRNPSIVLMLLFVIWVLAPFGAYWWANSLSKNWPGIAQTTLHAVVLIFTLILLGIFGYVAFGPPRLKTAAPFLIAPPVSCVLAAFTVWIASLRSGRAAPTPPSKM